MKQKRIDAVATVAHLPERDAFLAFTDIYLYTPLVIITRDDTRQLGSLDELKNLRLVLVEGYSSSKEVMTLYPALGPFYVATPLDGLNAVASGRGDAYVGALGVNSFIASQHGINNLKVNAAFDMSENGQRFGVRKDWPQLASPARQGAVRHPGQTAGGHIATLAAGKSQRNPPAQRADADQSIVSLAAGPGRALRLAPISLCCRLKQATTASQRDDACGAVLFIDLDRFKTLNDTLGHDMGDLLLQQVAQRLVGSVREGDTVARLGGDEFVVVLERLDSALEEAAVQTRTVGEKILESLRKPFSIGNTDRRHTASIGATLFRGHEVTIDDLLRQADLAMYKAKESGRNTLRFFDAAMQSIILEHAALEADRRWIN